MTISALRAPQAPAAVAGPAHVIRSDGEALAVAARIAGRLAEAAAERDRERRLPFDEIEELSRSGLLAITVPQAFGGAGVSASTLARVTALLAAADGSIGQIPQNHFFLLEALRLDGTPEQQRFFFELVLRGQRLGNALAERGTRKQGQIETVLRPEADGFSVTGRKFYATGTLFAHWIVVAAADGQQRRHLAFIEKGAPGLEVEDDWNGFGQRTTGSGTVQLAGVRVPAERVVPHYLAFARPTRMGAFAQLIHAAIDLGIAQGAFRTMLDFVRQHARAAADAPSDRITDDPYVLQCVGDLKVRLREAEASLSRAAALVDAAKDAPDAAVAAAASIAVAEAKILATEVSLDQTSGMFELMGSRAVAAPAGLDRYWRDARTHTLHDPVRWKYHAVGNYWLNGVHPPRHGAL